MNEMKLTNRDMNGFLALSPAERMQMAVLPQEQMNEVEAVIRVLPNVKCSARAYTENADDMTMADAVTWEFKIEYPSLKENEFPGYVHSNHYPFLKKQSWFIMVTDVTKEKTIFVQKQVFRGKKTEEGRVTNLRGLDKEPKNVEIFEVRQRLGKAGSFKFLVTFMNDSYVGFDQEVLMEFTLAEEPNRDVFEYLEEDIMAVKGPGLVQQMLDVKGDESESEDEDKDLDEVARLEARLKRAGHEGAMERSNKVESSELAYPK